MYDNDSEAMPPVVVGVDGSAASLAALRWALREARHRQTTLHAIWVIPPQPLLPATSMALQPYGRRPAEDVDTYQEKLHALVADAQRELRSPVHVHERAVTGDPVPELVRESRPAATLVLGHAGHHTLTDSLLGSVAQGCVHDALCPVTLINPRAAERQVGVPE